MNQQTSIRQPFRGSRLHGILLLAAPMLVLVASIDSQGVATAQNAAAPSAFVSTVDANEPVGGGRILLVLPFDNQTPAASQAKETAQHATETPQSDQLRSGLLPGVDSGKVAGPSTKFGSGNPAPSNLDWLREAAPTVLNSRFASAGFLPLSREDRIYALDHLGLPESFQPSRATALRLAQTLDANYILIGSFRVDGDVLTLKSRIVDVDKLRISEEVTEKGALKELIPLLNSLAWQLTRKLDPSFRVAEETFRAAGGKVRLDAFEQYIRGVTENDLNDLNSRAPSNLVERRRHLQKATELSPNFTEAWLATGKLEFEAQDYEQAAVAFGKVARGDPEELEADFYRGLSLMFTGNYPRAEEAFAAIARVLPLPEVVNNEGVAVSRRGHDAVALFREAVASDPTDADYHFNLAVSLHNRGEKSEALKELAASLKLHPDDSEAKAAEAAWASSSTGSVQASTDSVAPLERIKRAYNGAAFREAGLMLEQVEEARLAALPNAQRAALLSKTAHEKLDHGLLLEAERGYAAALAADDRNSDAYAGLAEVRERAGDPDAARKEAMASNQRKPNAEAYMVLARVDLAANNLTQARDEAIEAVRLDASNRGARDLRKTIESRIESRTGGAASSGSNRSAPSPASE